VTKQHFTHTLSLTLAACFAIAVFAVGLSSASPIMAQATPTATASGPSNSLNGNLFTCTDSVILRLDGNLLSGFSAFFQIFSGAAGSGTSLSNLRQVSVEGALNFAERIPYPAGTTIPEGQAASARVLVARSGDPTRIDFEFVLTDVNDGCGNANTAATITGSTDTGTGASTGTTTTTTTDPSLINLPAPNGQTLNPNLSPESLVVIGARPSDRFRSQTPGLIYAACENFPLALPGLIYDTDNVVVYWSWFTRTLEQMQQHLDNAQYSVRMNGETFFEVVRSEPQLIGGNYYVFYQSTAGLLRPGHYEVEYRLTWANPVNDGFADFGPGTANAIDFGNCNFDVLRNTQGLSVDYTDMFFPTTYPTHNIFPDT
jgi:hypothetical protein